METPDQFSRTFLPAANAAGVRPPAANRHLPVVRRCVGPRDATMLVARCCRTGAGGEHLIVLTRLRLVVTERTGLLRRLRLHLNSELYHLSDVTWTAEPDLAGVWLAATAVDGVREHFWIQAGDTDGVRRTDRLLGELFGGTGDAAADHAAADHAAVHHAAPVAVPVLAA